MYKDECSPELKEVKPKSGYIFEDTYFTISGFNLEQSKLKSNRIFNKVLEVTVAAINCNILNKTFDVINCKIGYIGSEKTGYKIFDLIHSHDPKSFQ
jgi:hypothetical protein